MNSKQLVFLTLVMVFIGFMVPLVAGGGVTYAIVAASVTAGVFLFAVGVATVMKFLE